MSKIFLAVIRFDFFFLTVDHDSTILPSPSLGKGAGAPSVPETPAPSLVPRHREEESWEDTAEHARVQRAAHQHLWRFILAAFLTTTA